MRLCHSDASLSAMALFSLRLKTENNELYAIMSALNVNIRAIPYIDDPYWKLVFDFECPALAQQVSALTCEASNESSAEQLGASSRNNAPRPPETIRIRFTVFAPYAHTLESWRRIANGEEKSCLYPGHGDCYITVEGGEISFVGIGRPCDAKSVIRMPMAIVGSKLNAVLDDVVRKGGAFQERMAITIKPTLNRSEALQSNDRVSNVTDPRSRLIVALALSGFSLCFQVFPLILKSVDGDLAFKTAALVSTTLLMIVIIHAIVRGPPSE